MANRAERARVAQETLDLVNRGTYRAASGREVDLRAAIDHAVGGSVLYRPEDFGTLNPPARNAVTTRFEVVNAGTLTAAARMLADEPAGRVIALNFASAKNPGGGFLSGSQAQEESLARASALYRCLEPLREMYEFNRRGDSCLYSDHMIYSPDVPVFRRDDDDALLEQPYLVSMITAPAVNAGAVRSNEPNAVAKIEPVMRSRIAKVLAVAAHHGHRDIILGAWGCGVFQNSSDDVARWFAEQLRDPAGPFAGVFERVVFAVLDRSEDRGFFAPFERQFAGA
jgi:uncharacterized protein (TIGR02452 family)